jgi:hypothetical protein
MVLRRGSTDPILLGPQRDVQLIAVSPDGRWVATGTWTGMNEGVFVWDAATGRRVAVVPTGDTGAVAFTPDGRWLATGRASSGARLWHAGSWAPGPSLGEGNDLWFSPDGALLAHSTLGDRIRLQDPQTGRILATLEDPLQGRCASLAFTPDGTHLVCDGDKAGSLHVWDLRLIRRQLASLGLDWDRPAYPPAPEEPEAPVAPLIVRVEAGDTPGLLRLGVDHARHERWTEAATAFDQLVERQPRNPKAWMRHTLTRLAIGDDAGYRAACARMLDRFGTTGDFTTANMVAWLGSLAPSAVSDRPRLVALAESSLASRPGDFMILNTLGATLYRAGRFEDSARALTEAIRRQGGEGTAYDHLFLAMAHDRLGHTEEAHRWHARAARWIAAAGHGPIQHAPIPTPLDWDSRLELHLLSREAESLLGRPLLDLPDDVFAPEPGLPAR